MKARPISDYARELRGALPPTLFAPVRNRLLWLALHLATVGVGLALLWRGVGGTAGAWILALVIGHAFACMAFVGHETMHGAVVRAPRWRYLVGYVCFLPFVLSPRLWVAWHNRVHHGNTGVVGVDPDAYPTLEEYRASRLKRVADYFSFGRRRWVGLLVTMAVGFTGQSLQILVRLARPHGYLSPRAHRLAVGETLLGGLVWTAVGVGLGGHVFLFGFVLPLLVGNALVIAYILTNHSLSPLTDVNDPLLNSLSVTVPWPFAALHLHFGLHVEHHLFPAMSSARAPEVRRLLLQRWPERYQTMSLVRALARLAATNRVYADTTTLIDPKDGRRWRTLLPREAPLRRLG